MTGPGKLYAGLTDQQLVAAESIGELREFTAGQIVFQEGEPGDCLYVVVRGSVAITKTANSDRHQLLSKVSAGNLFGEMSVIDTQPRSAHATAEESTVLRILRRDDLDQLLTINPQILFNLFNIVSERLRSMNTQFVEQIVHREKMTLVGQMANSIMHDIRNPLTVIRTQAELMGRDERVSGRCRSIQRNVDQITTIANDLLDFSRGVVSLRLQQIAPHAWLDEVLSLLKPMLEGTNIALKCEVLTQELLLVDSDRLSRAIYNLAVNAVQAMRDKGTLTVRVTRDPQGVEITLSDNGPGIPEEIRERLFDPFVTSGKRGGTGLGTSIAKKIVEDHGGQISFQTQTGLGTTFHIRLPSNTKSSV
jgi:signal transduction histidine kinase